MAKEIVEEDDTEGETVEDDGEERASSRQKQLALTDGNKASSSSSSSSSDSLADKAFLLKHLFSLSNAMDVGLEQVREAKTAALKKQRGKDRCMAAHTKLTNHDLQQLQSMTMDEENEEKRKESNDNVAPSSQKQGTHPDVSDSNKQMVSSFVRRSELVDRHRAYDLFVHSKESAARAEALRRMREAKAMRMAELQRRREERQMEAEEMERMREEEEKLRRELESQRHAEEEANRQRAEAEEAERRRAEDERRQREELRRLERDAAAARAKLESERRRREEAERRWLEEKAKREAEEAEARRIADDIKKQREMEREEATKRLQQRPAVEGNGRRRRSVEVNDDDDASEGKEHAELDALFAQADGIGREHLHSHRPTALASIATTSSLPPCHTPTNLPKHDDDVNTDEEFAEFDSPRSNPTPTHTSNDQTNPTSSTPTAGLHTHTHAHTAAAPIPPPPRGSATARSSLAGGRKGRTQAQVRSTAQVQAQVLTARGSMPIAPPLPTSSSAASNRSKGVGSVTSTVTGKSRPSPMSFGGSSQFVTPSMNFGFQRAKMRHGR